MLNWGGDLSKVGWLVMAVHILDVTLLLSDDLDVLVVVVETARVF